MYDKVRDSVTTYKLSDDLSDKSTARQETVVRAIYQDKQGRILFGVDQGVLSYQETDKKWVFKRMGKVGLDASGEPGDVNYIMEDRSGEIWVVTTAGIAVLEG